MKWLIVIGVLGVALQGAAQRKDTTVLASWDNDSPKLSVICCKVDTTFGIDEETGDLIEQLSGKRTPLCHDRSGKVIDPEKCIEMHSAWLYDLNVQRGDNLWRMGDTVMGMEHYKVAINSLHHYGSWVIIKEDDSRLLKLMEKARSR